MQNQESSSLKVPQQDIRALIDFFVILLEINNSQQRSAYLQESTGFKN